MSELTHKHILVNAEGVRKPFLTEEKVIDWLNRMVEAVGMTVLIPAQAKYCPTEGNEGVTGAVVIETSHGTIHIWPEAKTPFFRFDLYSCKDFDPNVVMKLVCEMDPKKVEFLIVTRNVGERMRVEQRFFNPHMGIYEEL